MDFRKTYRRIVPASARRWLRKTMRDVPLRMRDFPSDLKDRLGSRPDILPPATLRKRVGINSARQHFEDVDRAAAADIYGAVKDLGLTRLSCTRWMDFGCGAGRVARHLTTDSDIHLTGADIDVSAIRWCASHLRGNFVVVKPDPPTSFADESFDVIYVVSVFTHFDEASQFAWLAELRRILRPGGVLVATTQGEHLTYNRPDMTADDHRALQEHGFVFRRGFGDFNEESAFHTRAYLERAWKDYFWMTRFTRGGLAGYLDLSIWIR